MGMLYNRLLIIINEESQDSTAYHIAITMLENMGHITVMAINEVAKLCSVSKSTISKFIRTLGYEDYAEFRYAAIFAENKYKNTTNYVTDVMNYIERNKLRMYIDTLHADIELTFNDMDWNAVDRLVKDLAAYEKVAAFGLMFSETAAMDLQIKLAYNKKFIITNINDLKQDSYIQNAKEDTLIIAFSDSGEFINKYTEIEDFISKHSFSVTKAKVVAITSNEALLEDSRVDYCVLYKRTDTLHTHRIIYPVLTDIIAFKYRELMKKQTNC